jgi:hypothetical protein
LSLLAQWGVQNHRKLWEIHETTFSTSDLFFDEFVQDA